MEMEMKMKRQLGKLSVVLAFLLSVCSVTYAAQTDITSIQKDINVSVKYICDSKGGASTWDSAEKAATFTIGDKTLKLKINSNQIVANGKAKVLKEKVIVSGGRIILPLSIVNQELGVKMSSDDYLKIAAAKFIELTKATQIYEGSSLLSTSLKKYLTPAYLQMYAVSLSAVQFDDKNASISKNTVHQNVAIPCVIQQINYNFVIRFDYDGKIDDMNTTAVVSDQMSYSAPVYDNQNNYTEKQIIIGDGDYKLPATLTIPSGKGPFPVVILVHGSGPNDRDESLGPLKPFRDIAVGLASKNIAVLRYEKRTLEYGTKMQLSGNITMNEEFEQDVFAAAKYLNTVNEIDSSNIFVLGHSQGGYVLPRILQSDKTGIFKAGIIMSGCSRPIYELMPEQYEYLMNKGMATKEQVDYMKAQVKLLEDENFDPNNLPAGYSLGNGYYYYDMKNYDVAAAAKAVNRPMLVLQGERDYQVSPKTDFEGWKKAFSENKNVEYKLYQKLNHMYTEGEGDCTPLEYYKSANIPQYVIDDISTFINKTAGK
jgi:dienelactone hydrolase